MNGWFAGAASTIVEIPIGTPMAGYAARIGPSIGTLDSLGVSSLLLECDAGRFAILAMDLVAVDYELVCEIAERAGFEPGRLAVCASHTHCGPAGVSARLHPAERPRLDARLRDQFVTAAGDCLVRAEAALEPATLSFGSAAVDGVSANRLDLTGPHDPTISVLRALSKSGAPIATVVHFACHPTVLPAECRMISADFPGSIRRVLDPDRFGTVLFANGAAGDVSTRFTRASQDERELERIGRIIADAAADLASPTPVDASLEVRTIHTTLVPRSVEELREELERAHNSNSGEAVHDRIEATRRQGISLLESMAGNQTLSPTDVHVGIWRLGHVTLIGFPGELFASHGLALTTVRDERTLTLGYTNGYAGYFPDRAAYVAGSYEALASPWSSASVDDLIDTIRRSL